MKLKKRIHKKVTMEVYQMRSMIIITLLATLLLVNVWSRFKEDVLSISWYIYVILIVLFAIPLFIKPKKKKK
ncbi:hypothetical protein KAI04_02880 [Candidatus Pacearchaeota archaeon]|nr:hypothetical protein [Candidatus Pacearchaeota archaeon]